MNDYFVMCLTLFWTTDPFSFLKIFANLKFFINTSLFVNNSRRRVISVSGTYVITDVSEEFVASILWICVITHDKNTGVKIEN
jgi:hypothetical protein